MREVDGDEGAIFGLGSFYEDTRRPFCESLQHNNCVNAGVE